MQQLISHTDHRFIQILRLLSLQIIQLIQHCLQGSRISTVQDEMFQKPQEMNWGILFYVFIFIVALY